MTDVQLRQCPQCGNTGPVGVPRCAVCGYPRRRAARSGPTTSSIVIFGLFGVPAFFLGAAFLVASVGEMALLFLAIFAVTLALVINSWKRR
jgi:hypothetical protein